MSGRSWADMRPEDFDTDVRPAVDEGLFALDVTLVEAPDDGVGTADLFELETSPEQ